MIQIPTIEAMKSYATDGISSYALVRRLLSASAILLACFVLRAADVRDGLVSYWPLDAVDGGTTADVGFMNTMTVVGDPAVSPGKVGNALTFVGPNTYLTNLHASDAFADAGLPIYQAGTYTVCMWVKGTNQTAKYLFAEGSVEANAPLFILQTGQAAANNAKLDVIIRTDGNSALLNHIASSNIVFDDTWHHIAWVDDNGDARLYVDGQRDAANFRYTRSGTFTFSSTAIGTLVRAAISTGAIFNGQIDDVAIWERALSQAEIDVVRTTGIPTPIAPRPPSLYALPADTTRQNQDWARFSVLAYANRPYHLFTYQWFKNGDPIPEATARTYQTPHLTPTESGDRYSVAVSNSVGATLSPEARLTVVADPAPDLRTGLVSYWPLNEINLVETNFLSPDLYSHTDFVLMGFLDPTDVVPGYSGNALAFNFVDRYAYRTNGTAIYSHTNYSISMWVQADYAAQNDRRIFSEGSPTNNTPIFTLGTDNAGSSPSARVYIRTDANAVVNARNSARPVFDNAWHHLVWTDANGDARLYIDGILDETDFAYTRGPTTVSITSVGAVLRTAPDFFFFGNIDEVAAWNRPLSWTEIQEVYSQGVPLPISAIPPTIQTQPADRTNNVFTGDTIALSVIANGTLPLHYQWWKDDAPIPAAANPSAITDTLVLANAQLPDNGAYSVVITNSGGSITSSVVRLELAPYTPATAGEVLKIDIGLAGSPNVQPGFQEFTLAMNGTNYGGVGVTLAPIGAISLASRHRIADPYVTNQPPELTQAPIYDDFVFASSAVENNGLSVLIERLSPNTPYGVTIWSYDPASTGMRVANWTETASGSPVAVADAYTFYATNLPASDYAYTFGGVVTSSASGKLRFEGRRNAASVNAAGNADIGVFINAIRLVARPAGTRIERFESQESLLRLRVLGDYPGQPIELEQSYTLAPGSWGAAAGASTISTNGPLVLFEVPITPSNVFFRAKSQ